MEKVHLEKGKPVKALNIPKEVVVQGKT